MTIVNEQTLNRYRNENTRAITLPDNSRREIRMTPDLWESLEFLELCEIITQQELAKYALEEMTLEQDVTFDRAFRGLVAFVANLWAEDAKMLFSDG